MKPRIEFLYLLILLIFSCKEAYYPDLNNNEKMLVVNGTITNEHKTYSISLSWARTFNEDADHEPVRNAQVYITDNCYETYYFSEGNGGNYFSDSILFIPKIGNSYKLNILLDNGEKYESDYQELLPIETLGEVSGKIIQKDFIVDDGNSTLVKTYDGIETCIQIPANNREISKYRFNTKVSIQYSWGIDLGATQHTYYCWSTLRNPNPNINVTINNYALDVEGAILHSLCFLPKNNDFWGLDHNYNCFVIQIDAYRLNDQSYSYYRKAYEQLDANNTIFDPIAVQLPSNIKCVNGYKRIALGCFEVSSLSNYAYYILEGYSSQIHCVNNPDFPRNLNFSKCIIDSIPDFWYSRYIN